MDERVNDIEQAFETASYLNRMVDEADEAIANLNNEHPKFTPKMSLEYESDTDYFTVTIDDSVSIDTKDGGSGLYIIKGIGEYAISVISDELTEDEEEEEFEILFTEIEKIEQS